MATRNLTPIIFFRVGYMDAYDGTGSITNGGSHIQDEGSGGEMWNFLSNDGLCHGYVMSKNFAGVDLTRVASETRWSEGDQIDGVDVVFFSKKPNVGQVIVGWYRSARVFHKEYRELDRPRLTGERWSEKNYLCDVQSQDAYLIPEGDRAFKVPRGKGFSGTSNVWYADSDAASVRKYVQTVRDYMDKSQKSSKNRVSSASVVRGWASAPDKDMILKIECAAVARTIEYYELNGFKVKSVEKECRGWDLEASKGRQALYIEVKGHLGENVCFELTPNEYLQLKRHPKKYRISVVLDALRSGKLSIFLPSETPNGWVLKSDSNADVRLVERIGARAAETE